MRWTELLKSTLDRLPSTGGKVFRAPPGTFDVHRSLFFTLVTDRVYSSISSPAGNPTEPLACGWLPTCCRLVLSTDVGGHPTADRDRNA